MLVLKFFHRARKVPVSEEELKAKKKKKDAVKKKEDEESSHTECERKDDAAVSTVRTLTISGNFLNAIWLAGVERKGQEEKED
jgi:hypothetical protein